MAGVVFDDAALPHGVVEMSLERLRVWPGNPRRITEARLDDLKRALEADREMLGARPLLALPDGLVFAGNQRLRAARELGWQTIPVLFLDLDPERARAVGVARQQQLGRVGRAAAGRVAGGAVGRRCRAGFDRVREFAG